ncbi:MAG: RNA polymerase sigma factor [Armatimonadetes bacterium]|nr:RNA polymerase sigma factor [Armatimonadota bacterium]
MQADDKEMMDGLKAGHEWAFRQLLDRYEVRMFQLAYRMLGCRADAEDAAQEIFLEVYRSIARFQGRAAFSTWLYRVAVNVCLEFRRRRRRNEVPLSGLENALSDGRDVDPEESAMVGELQQEVHKAILSLPEPHRQVVVLHELQGLTYAEIAKALNCPVGTVKSRLFHAFRKLRESLQGYMAEGRVS